MFEKLLSIFLSIHQMLNADSFTDRYVYSRCEQQLFGSINANSFFLVDWPFKSLEIQEFSLYWHQAPKFTKIFVQTFGSC